jgi:hypothetical protein
MSWILHELFGRCRKPDTVSLLVILYLATSPEVLGISGRHFKVASLQRASPASNDEVAARRLWQICEAMTKEK